jgi:hypothetical protein
MLETIGHISAVDSGYFGFSIALSADGQTLAVGAYCEGSGAPFSCTGAVYIYRFDSGSWTLEERISASNIDEGDEFGHAVSLSADGNILVAGSWAEDSATTGVDGDQSNNAVDTSGAAYVFRFDGVAWSQEAYLKASNTDRMDQFGGAVALSGAGDVLAIGAGQEDSSSPGVGGDQDDNSATAAGAVYIFGFDGADWSQQAYIKASNPETEDQFGRVLALSADGNTLAVGAEDEDSAAVGIDGDQNDNSTENAGAVYVFRFDGAGWFQQAYVKASNTESGDRFGATVALSADGNTLVAGAEEEDSGATGVNGNQMDNSAPDSGAAYVFRIDNSAWSQEAYIKSSNAGARDTFGGSSLWAVSIALSADGNNLVIGTEAESSNASGINGSEYDDSAPDAGAAYFFRFYQDSWVQHSYIKSSSSQEGDNFGIAVSMSANGDTLVIGAWTQEAIYIY